MAIPSPLIVDAPKCEENLRLQYLRDTKSLARTSIIKVLGATKEQNWRQQKLSVTLKIRRNLSYVYSIRGLI